jgi:hypothetical protein
VAQITSWTVEGQQVRVDLHLRNINEEPMPLLGVDLDLRLDDQPLGRINQALDSSIAASGFESVSLKVHASKASLALLLALQEGESRSLPYELKGNVTTAGNRKLEFDREGHIYPVPGRPGQFR